MQIIVYTDPGVFEGPNDPEIVCLDGLPKEDAWVKEHLEQNRKLEPNATFVRESDGAGGIGKREWYWYAPDLNNPHEKETVVLTGTLRFRSKALVQSLDTGDGALRVRASAYELRDVDPPGVYYEFESSHLGSTEWNAITAFRLQNFVPISANQVRIVTDQVAFVFGGATYAVTTDGARTWSTWYVEDSLEALGCPDSASVLDVHLEPSGAGVMNVEAIASGKKIMRTFYSSDYGRHWGLN